MPYPFFKRWMRRSNPIKRPRQSGQIRECVALSFLASRYDDLQGAVQSACDQFVPPLLEGAAERAEMRRLIGALLFAPALFSIAIMLLFSTHFGVAAALAAVSAVFALSWAGVLAAVSLRKVSGLRSAALVGLAMAVASLVASAGGLASPAALLLAALPLEAYWVRRSKHALLAGLAAGAVVGAALAGGIAVRPDVFGEAVSWHWLLPLGYVATLWPRLARSGTEWERRDEAVGEDGLDNAVDGVLLRLARSGEIVHASQKTHEILNLAPGLLCGSGLFDRLHVADRVPYMCALGELRDGGTPQRVIVRVRLPKSQDEEAASFLPCAVTFCGADASGDFRAVLRDHSEIAGLEEALAAAVDKTEGLDIAKGRFLAAVSHELRTPLNAIIGFSDILLHEMFGGFTDVRQREYTELIKESGHHLLSVVNAILDVSKIKSGTYAIQSEPFAFGDAAEMCRSMMALQAAKKGIDLRTQIAQTAGDIVGDRRAVQQILINLVANAIKFTPDNGSVVLGAQRLGSRLHFWVADNGIGIAAEDLDRIGRPFTQIRNDYTRQFEGTGLGLSLVKGLVGLHEGTMSIESAPGEGTKVSISLPIDGPQGAQDTVTRVFAPAGGEEVSHGTLRKTA